MCEPMTIAMAGLSAMRSVSEISNQNQYAASTRSNAIQAANDETAQTQQGYVEQSRSLIQGAFDAVLQGREAESLAYTSAIENGVQGNSVKNMLRTTRQKTGRTKSRFKMEQESLMDQTGQNLRHIGTKAQGRINSAPTTSFGLGDIASIATPIIRGEME